MNPFKIVKKLLSCATVLVLGTVVAIIAIVVMYEWQQLP